MKIAVLGSGIMGRVVTMQLHLEGFTNITLFDKDSQDGALSPATIAAGMLAPYSESVMGGKLIYKLGVTSINLWHKYLSILNASHLLNNNGTILVAHPNFQNEIKHCIDKIKFNIKRVGNFI